MTKRPRRLEPSELLELQRESETSTEMLLESLGWINENGHWAYAPVKKGTL